jgi:hypothetical protein
MVNVKVVATELKPCIVSPLPNTNFSWSKLTVSPAGIGNALTIIVPATALLPLGTAYNVKLALEPVVLQIMIAVIALPSWVPLTVLVYSVPFDAGTTAFAIAIFLSL